MCEYVAEKTGREVNPETMLCVIDAIDLMIPKSKKRKSKKGNPWGRGGKPKC